MKRHIVRLATIYILIFLMVGGCGGGGGGGASGGSTSSTNPLIADKPTALRAIADFAQAEEDAYANLVLTFSNDGSTYIFDPSATLSKPSKRARTVGTEVQFLNITSIQGVSNNPSVKSTLTVSGDAHITKIFTYHWNGGSGSTPGTLALRNSSTGTVYGPWTAIGTNNGADLTPGAVWPTSSTSSPYLYWLAQPNSDIPAGTYEVVDSSPSTWAYTSDSGNRGLCAVLGWLTGSATTNTATSTGTGTGTSTNVTSPGASAAYLRMYDLQQKVLDKYDLFDAAMTYLDTQASGKPAGAAVQDKGKRGIIKSIYNLAFGFKQSADHASASIVTTMGKLDSAGQQAAYNVALNRYHATGTGNPGASPAEFIQNLKDGKLNAQAAQLNNELIVNQTGESSAYQDAAGPNAIEKAVVKEGLTNMSNAVDVVRDTLTSIAPPIGEGIDKADKFINAVNNPQATIEQAMTNLVAQKLGVDPAVVARAPDLVREIQNQANIYRNRHGLVTETEALGTDGKVAVSGGQTDDVITAIDKTTNKIIVGTGATGKLLPPGTYKLIILTKDNRVVKVDNVVVTKGNVTSVTIPAASTGTGTGTGTSTGGGTTSWTAEWGQYHLRYTITGATLVVPPDYTAPFGYDVYNYSGTMDGTALAISGTGWVEQPSAAADDFNYTLSVSVSVGADSKSYSYTAPVGEILNKPFNLSVPIPAGATTGGFSMRVDYANSNYGPRGVVVTGTVTK